MQIERRNFFKTLTATLAGVVLSNKIRVAEKAEASLYPVKFKENSIRRTPFDKDIYTCTDQFMYSGIVPTNRWH